MTSRVRILCIDDHPFVRAGVIRVIGLQEELTVVAEGSTGEEAVELFVQHRPDVTVMDLQLPGMGGLQAIRAIKEVTPEAKVVVLTMYDGSENILNAVRAGAVGFVLKDAVPEDLIRVIGEVSAGRTAFPGDVEAQATSRGEYPPLTRREKEVLQLLVNGMRNKEIASALGISEDTTRVHLRSVFLKLHVHDRTAALVVALRLGLVRI
ncbi:MAG: response regulator transcription factor [Acidobacteriota bacterium]